MSPLRVVIVAPPYYRVPPDGYGGTERVCSLLADGLVARGHEVTLIAVAGSRTRADLVATFSEPQPEGTGDDAFIEVAHAAQAAAAIESLRPDVVHDHTRAGPLTAVGRSGPTVVTVHTPVGSPCVAGVAWHALRTWVSCIAISDAQRRSAPELPWAATVHNGIDVDAYPLCPNKEPFLLYLGRISASKGVHLAIDAAEQVGCPLTIAGSATVPEEQDYFDREIRPRLGRSVTWVGEVSGARRLELLGRASCTLFPAIWEEPFGLVLIESMACGTPVVGLRRGSLPEIVAEGVSGVLCDDPADLAAAAAAATTLSPQGCRAHVVARFPADTMVARYEEAYRSVLRR